MTTDVVELKNNVISEIKIDPKKIGVKFNNPDDYKNWQMANLNALITSEDVFSLTLDTLKEKNNSWNSYTIEDRTKISPRLKPKRQSGRNKV